MPGWSITLAEYASKHGEEEDFKRFGGPFSHPFLIVEDENGKVREEIHGRWRNTIRTRQFVDLADYYDGALKGESFPDLYPMAVVSPCAERDTHRAIARQPVFEGTKEEGEAHIAALKLTIENLNAERHPFYRYARRGTGFANCQLILGEAIARTKGFPPVPGLKLAHTGWTGGAKLAINQSHEHA